MTISEDEANELRRQIVQKDEILNTMKIKTKEFVQKLKDDHSQAMGAVEQSLNQTAQQLLEATKKVTSLEAALSEKNAAVDKLTQQNHLLSLSVGNADVAKNDHAADLKSLQDALTASKAEADQLKSQLQQSESSLKEMQAAGEALKKRESESRSMLVQMKAKLDEETQKNESLGSSSAADGSAIADLKAQVAALQEQLKAAGDASSAEQKQYDDQVKSLQTQVETLRKGSEESSELSSKVNEGESLARHLRMELELTKDQLKQLREAEAAKANDAFLLKKTYEENVAVHGELTARHADLQRQCEELEHQLSGAKSAHEAELQMREAALVEQKRVGQAVQRSYDELSVLFSNAQAQLASEQASAGQVQAELTAQCGQRRKELEQARSKHIEECAELQREADDAQKASEVKAAGLQKQLDEALAKLSGSAAEEVRESQRAAEDVSRLQAELEEARKTLAQVQDDLRASNDRSEALTAEVSGLTAKQAAELEELARLRAQQTELSAEVDRLKASESASCDGKAGLEALQASLDALTAEHNTSLQTIADLTAVLETAKSQLVAKTDESVSNLGELQQKLDAMMTENAELTASQSELVDGLKELNAAREELLASLDSEAAERAVVAESLDQLRTVLAETQSEREALSKQLAEAQASNADLKGLLTAVQENFAALEAKYGEDVSASAESTKSMEGAQEQLARLQKRCDELTGENQRLEASLSEMQNNFINVNNSADKLQIKYESTRLALEEAQQQLAETDAARRDLQVKYEQQLQSLDVSSTQNTALTEQAAACLQTITGLERRVDDQAAQIDALSEQLTVARVEVTALQAANESMLSSQNTASAQQSSAAAEKIKALTEELAAVQAKHSDSLQYKEHSDQALANLKALYSDLQKSSTELQLKHDAIAATQEQSELFTKELKSRFLALQAQLTEAQATITQLKAQNSELADKVTSKEEAQSSASEKAGAELAQLQRERAAWSEEKAALEGVVSKLTEESKTIQTLRGENERLTAHIASLTDSHDKDLDSVVSQLADQTQKLKGLDKAHAALTAEAKRAAEEAERQRGELSESLRAQREEGVRLAAELEQASAALRAVESEAVKRQGEGQGELIILRTDLSSKTQLVAALQEEIQGLQGRIASLEADRSQHKDAAESLNGSIEDMTMSLRAKDEQVLSLQRSFDEREKNLKQQLVQLQTTSKNRIAELGKDVDRFSADLALKNAEIETHKSSSKSITQLNADLTRQLEETKAQLAAEVHRNAEQKKKVRTYLDNLTAENKTLTDRATAAEASLKEVSAARAVLEQRSAQLEGQLHSLSAQSSREIESLRTANHQMEMMFESQLGDRDREIQQLLVQVQAASQSSVEEVTATRARIEESMREMEAHKSKRLAARNEMIALAKSLERAQADGNEIKTTVQYNLTPLVVEQIASLESLVTNVEIIAFHLTSKKGSTALTSGMPPSPRQAASRDGPDRVNAFSNANSRGGGAGASNGATKNPLNLLDGEESHIPGRPLNRPASTNSMSGISDALVQVETLRIDLERVQMGITLMTLSVEKLRDIVTAQNSQGCCGGGIFEFLLMGSAAPSIRDSAGSYTSNSEGGSRARSPASGGGSGSNSRKLRDMFDKQQKAKQGYAGLGAEGDDLGASEHKPDERSSNFFSIESSMDESDL